MERVKRVKTSLAELRQSSQRHKKQPTNSNSKILIKGDQLLKRNSQETFEPSFIKTAKAISQEQKELYRSFLDEVSSSSEIEEKSETEEVDLEEVLHHLQEKVKRPLKAEKRKVGLPPETIAVYQRGELTVYRVLN